ADAQDRNIEVKQFRIAARSARLIDARRASGKNDARWLQGADALRRQVVADDLAKDIQLAHAPGDQLAVLRAEIEDQDAFSFRQRHHWVYSFERVSLSEE